MSIVAELNMGFDRLRHVYHNRIRKLCSPLSFRNEQKIIYNYIYIIVK